MNSNDPWWHDPFVHYPAPLAQTSRFEFWNEQHGRGIVVISRHQQTMCTVGWLASLILRRVLRRRRDDILLLNTLGNTLTELHQRYDRS